MRNGGCLPQPPFLRRLPGGVIDDPQLRHMLHGSVGGIIPAGCLLTSGPGFAEASLRHDPLLKPIP